MIGRDVALPLHFAGIAAVALMSVLLCRRALFDKPELEQTGRVFAIPDRSLFNYGLIVFCSMACEGIMCDWSVVYFQDVISVDRKYIGLGFTVFMAAMTIGRLMLNRFVDRIGVRITLQWGGMLAFTGMTLTTWLPGLVTSIIGFFWLGLAFAPLFRWLRGRPQGLLPWRQAPPSRRC